MVDNILNLQKHGANLQYLVCGSQQAPTLGATQNEDKMVLRQNYILALDDY